MGWTGGTAQSGDLLIIAADKEKKILGSVPLKGPINSSPVAANGVLYITTGTRLYAVHVDVE